MLSIRWRWRVGPTSSRSSTARVHACIDVHLWRASAALRWPQRLLPACLACLGVIQHCPCMPRTRAVFMTLLSVCLNLFLNACLCLVALASRLFCFVCVHTCGYARRLHLSRRTRDRVHARLLYRVARAPDGTETHAMPSPPLQKPPPCRLVLIKCRTNAFPRRLPR